MTWASGLTALREEAAGQHDLVLASRLSDLGVSPAQHRRLRREGWLVEVRRGVLLVGGSRPTEWHKVVAAALMAGPAAAISHATAARIHRFVCVGPPAGSPVDITVPRSCRSRLDGCRVHRSLHLPETDVLTHRGIRVTTPVRTLVDMAPLVPVALLEKTVDEGLIARLWSERELAAGVEAAAGRAGIDKLRPLIAVRSDGGPTKADLEGRVGRVLAPFAPFETQHQVMLDGHVYVIDVAWPAYRVAIECDGWEVRSRSRGKFDADRRKDNHLTSHGWTVVHLTSAMSDDEMRAAVLKVLLRAAAR
ncbi:MAG TPA: type IV toxin-antitoxin system AbiEi family antitoxin domain-containing protein [Acidimicrobiales bacterium]|nr:type IV toxin-antitoxin system AbiEi family antitoxin domain-containing protein [Acidimicrobiales bacterium]